VGLSDCFGSWIADLSKYLRNLIKNVPGCLAGSEDLLFQIRHPQAPLDVGLQRLQQGNDLCEKGALVLLGSQAFGGWPFAAAANLLVLSAQLERWSSMFEVGSRRVPECASTPKRLRPGSNKASALQAPPKR